MKKVLVYGMLGSIGGIETFLMTLYKNIDRNKLQFDFIFNHNQGEIAFEEEIQSLGGNVYRVCYGLKENPYLAYKSYSKFFKDHKGEYIALHVNSCFIGSSLILKYAKKYKIPVRIFHSHNNDDMYPSNSIIKKYISNHEYNNIIKYSTNLLACSDLAGKYMFHENSFKIIPNSIDIEKYKFNQDVRNIKRKELGINDKDFVIGFVGRLQYQKNPLFLIEVFNSLSKKLPNAKLMITGVGNLLDDINNKIKEYNLEDKVLMLGTRTDVNELYSSMDCFVLPSLFEGLGIVLIEAQCSGLPCIATSNTIPESAKVSDNFQFVELNNLDAWGQAILDASNKNIDRNNEYKAVAKAGYDAKELAKLMENIYLGRN